MKHKENNWSNWLKYLGLIISQKGSPGGMLLNIQLGNAQETLILIFPSKCVGPLQGQT
jgi:hypothetical protein